MEEPLVTLLITNYNYREFLEAAIASCARQTYRRLELIVADDGSTDGSDQYLRQLADRWRFRFDRIELQTSRQNRGKLAVLNASLPKATGQALVILDADDFLDEHFVDQSMETLITNRQRNKRLAFVYTDCWLVDYSGHRLARGRSSQFDAQLVKAKSYIADCALTLMSAVKAILPFDESIRVGTKHHKWVKMVDARWEGYYLEVPLFNYRMHDRNLSGIGAAISRDLASGNLGSPILSGYWPRAQGVSSNAISRNSDKESGVK